MERRTAFSEAVQGAEALAERHHRGLSRHLRARVDVDDLRQEARLALWEASGRWDPRQGDLSRFAYLAVQGAILDCIGTSCRGPLLPLEDGAEDVPDPAPVDLDATLDAQRAYLASRPVRQAAAELGYGDPRRHLSVQEVAQLRGLSVRVVQKRIAEGAIRGVRRGRVWRVPAWAAAG